MHFSISVAFSLLCHTLKIKPAFSIIHSNIVGWVCNPGICLHCSGYNCSSHTLSLPECASCRGSLTKNHWDNGKEAQMEWSEEKGTEEITCSTTRPFLEERGWGSGASVYWLTIALCIPFLAGSGDYFTQWHISKYPCTLELLLLQYPKHPPTPHFCSWVWTDHGENHVGQEWEFVVGQENWQKSLHPLLWIEIPLSQRNCMVGCMLVFAKIAFLHLMVAFPAIRFSGSKCMHQGQVTF